MSIRSADSNDTAVLATRLPSAARAPATTSEQAIRFPGRGWALWPCVCVRGAGFPVTVMPRLSSTVSAQLVLRLLDERAARGKRPPPAHEARVTAAREALTDAFAAETRRIRRALQEIASQPAFREAVLWQNPSALRHAVDPLMAAPPDAVNSARRKHELLVASYVQRYHTKNDTIGFFGPVGWGAVGEHVPTIRVTCGAGLLATRNVYVESWCIDALARTLDGDADLRPWRVPRIAPFVSLDGATLMIGRRAARQLSPDHRRLLSACDGQRSARVIATALVSEGGTTFASEESIYATLDEWLQAGEITWSLEGPREMHAERTLRARLEQIDDAAVRSRSLAQLGRLESAIDGVRAAVGDVGSLRPAIDTLEATFTAITGAAPVRNEGRMYAARTLVYEDCRRDLGLELGASVVARLSRPLALVLQGARWAVAELARRHLDEFRRAYDQLAGARRGPVGLGAFLGRTSLLRQPPGSMSPTAAEVRSALQERWAGVLALPAGTRRIQYRSRDLRAAVSTAFSPPPGLLGAWSRHLSPDVMIDAPSVDAIERGEYQFVLGEVHPLITLMQATLVDQHPRPHQLTGWLDGDCPDPRVVWIVPKATMQQRVHHTLRPADFAWTMTADPSPVPPERTLRTADLVVADDAGRLVVRTRDGRRQFDCLEFLGPVFMRIGGSVFHMLPAASHQPRVTIDDLVVSREQWHVPVGELTFAMCGSDLDRYIECQRWARDRGLPQLVFAKMPNEQKPTYVDLSSPLFVDLFARFVRRQHSADPAALVTISEMLPGPAGAWLPGPSGERYACELRLVAVDTR